jgi:hypothetical protein
MNPPNSFAPLHRRAPRHSKRDTVRTPLRRTASLGPAEAEAQPGIPAGSRAAAILAAAAEAYGCEVADLLRDRGEAISQSDNGQQGPGRRRKSRRGSVINPRHARARFPGGRDINVEAKTRLAV